jgi:hypothetical protein
VIISAHLVRSTVSKKATLGLQFAKDLQLVLRRAIVEGRYRRMMRNLFCDIEALGTIVVLVPTAEDLAKDGIIPDEETLSASCRSA